MTARMEIKYIECLLLIRVDSLFMVTVEREPGGISFLWRRPWKTVGTERKSGVMLLLSLVPLLVFAERERAAKENDIPPGSRSTVTGFLFIV